MAATREQLVAIVDRSPAALAKQCKKSWLDIFASKAVVNDPVGTPKHKGPNELSRFYDSFIANNTITFNVQHDLVDLDAERVVRVTDIHIRFFHSKTYGMIQPAHIVYDVDSITQNVKGLRAGWQMTHARVMGSNLLEKYVVGLIVGSVSGGYGLTYKITSALEQRDAPKFVSLFYRPDSTSVQLGSQFVKPDEVWKALWNDTDKIEFESTIKSAGWQTSVCYRRKLVSGEVKLGFMLMEVLWRSPISSAIERIYIHEEDDQALGK